MTAAAQMAVTPDRCDALLDIVAKHLKHSRSSINTAKDLDSLHIELRFRPDGTLRVVRVFLNSEVEYDANGGIKRR